MRWLMIVLLLILASLQFRLWFGEGSISQKTQLDQELSAQQVYNEELKHRNKLIAKEVESLKNNLDAIEEKAREDLGMIKDNETFYLVIDKEEGCRRKIVRPESRMNQSSPKFWCIVPAAGIGSRFSADIPKQFHQLDDQLVAQHTLSRLLKLSIIEAIYAPCDDGFCILVSRCLLPVMAAFA